MNSLQELLDNYKKNHKKNKMHITHYLSAPLIIFSMLIFLGWFHISIPTVIDVHMAWIASIVLIASYFFLDWQLAAATAVVLFVVNIVAGFFSQPAPTFMMFIFFLICLAAGCAAQFIGHQVQGNKVDVEDYLMSLYTAPLFLVAEVLVHFGIRPDLKSHVDVSNSSSAKDK